MTVRSIVQNRILAGMDPESFACLRPQLQPIALKPRTVLQEQNRAIEHIYFIERGVASLCAHTRRDGPVAVAIVGRLGFVGVAAVLGTMRAPHRCVMETAGEALRIAANDLQRIMEDRPAVRQHLLGYVHALLVQNTQTALCNVRHGLEERLCRWLLLASERLDETLVRLTHDQLAMILGVRRAGITTTLANLEGVGGVIRRRAAVEIADRATLEKRSCECYRIIAAEYERITNSAHYRHVIERALPALARPTQADRAARRTTA